MKDWICAVVGALGAAVAAAFGGWTAGLTTLVVFMAADYATGLLAAGVFHASRKTEHGGLESRVGWKGLARKAVTLLLVLSAGRLELLLGVTYVRDAAVIGFCANELLSVTENAALMGVPLPRVLREALELLRRKGEEDTCHCEGGAAARGNPQIPAPAGSRKEERIAASPVCAPVPRNDTPMERTCHGEGGAAARGDPQISDEVPRKENEHD